MVNSLTGKRVRWNQYFFKTLSFQRTFVLPFVKDICYPQYPFGLVSPSLMGRQLPALLLHIFSLLFSAHFCLHSLLGSPQASPPTAAILQSLLVSLSSWLFNHSWGINWLPTDAFWAAVTLCGVHAAQHRPQRQRVIAGMQARSTDPILHLFPTV